MASDMLFPPPGPTPELLEVRPSFPEHRAIYRLEHEVIPWLKPSNEQQPFQSRKVHAQSALKSAEGFLRRRTSTGTQGFGGVAATRAEIEWQIGHLVEWATITGRLIDPRFAQNSDFDIGGVEHDVFHDEIAGRWLKITKPSKCGKAHYIHGEEVLGVPSALVLDDAFPTDYLERLRLANTNFGDRLCLHGVILTSAGARMVISQRHVPGGPATPEQITRYFEDHGFTQINQKTFYNSRENLLVSDAHTGNMIKTARGIIVAIDVIIQRPVEILRRTVTPRELLNFDEEPEPALIQS